jgi:hypothetical protein
VNVPVPTRSRVNCAILAVYVSCPSRDLVSNSHVVEINFSYTPLANFDKLRTNTYRHVHTVLPCSEVGAWSRVFGTVRSPNHSGVRLRSQRKVIKIGLTKPPHTRKLNETLSELHILHWAFSFGPQPIVVSRTRVNSPIIAIYNRCFTAGVTEAKVDAIDITNSPRSKLEEPVTTN